ncbi:hypothetical protein AVEN_87388-1 [Araneus ventricosus]|uniref:Uncharacterized protein n=1 Tax=Araneus ventricosus TaxID=182803 RepID=A0A4Y2IDH2_ARAVE|nr:hypothetical protein AVEN_87388-1 [Araneus ventricosus]
MRSCCRSVCFLLLIDSKSPPRVGRTWRSTRRVVHFGPWCINWPASQTFGWSAQGDQATAVNFWDSALRAEARKIVHGRTPKDNHSYTAALKIVKNPDTPLELILTPTETTDPKPSTSATRNEETITVILSDWSALLKAHNVSL